ncbi:multidrug efflux RND transporter permease subunit [Methylopila jiangsuensis]|uniref:Efflux pump membrane transporter n=1 Tax=Methylopila jiangsuensis TaxID=586230 RepID=A0A9W6JKJ8_9HYPH|nr:multidrug efflux RND transporter permease subunit [Methylopila jiangsuensis]MDR6284835.1 HAE1 family hydrophobic/amphiphilic exporter-1 [Methylopila jiangsuensis]GLK77774.1 multidrug efflux RND transporter permease subunit [Methylopila jiangsuensis]
MGIGHFFVDRPIFASVVSILLMIVGGVALLNLPIAQYPEIAPPTISVTAQYPGANAETIAETVAAPLEQQINGVEGMIYMNSLATGDGRLQLTVTFQPGTDQDIAQVQVQNRVAQADPRLPEAVRRNGVQVNKRSSDFLMVVNLISPDKSLDTVYMSNYASVNVVDALKRIEGVGDITIFGERELSLRVWLDPNRLAAYGLASGDVVTAISQQNVQVSGGSLGAPPAPEGTVNQITVTTQGRFQDPEQFKQIIVRATPDGRLLRVGDVARVELAARSYSSNSYLGADPTVGMGIFQRPGTNATDAAAQIQAAMETLKRGFPQGLEYRIEYNPTVFIEESITAVEHTIYEAVALVVLVVFVFLQSWRAAIIPVAAIPVSLIATFAVMAAFGFSLNMLTLFGLILAIGIVVDDAIVVVENVERNIALGKDPKDAAHVTMDEVGTAVIAIALVLCAVFVPTAFIPGISGIFYQQFALTIAASTVLSALVSLTLSPALCAILLRPHAHGGGRRNLAQKAADLFNRNFDRGAHGYSRSVGWMVRHKSLFLLIYAGLIGGAVYMFSVVPRGFIPQADQGYAILIAQLPEGANLQRTDEVARRAADIVRKVPGVKNAVTIAGFSGATFSAAANAATSFIIFEPFEERTKHGASQTAPMILAEAQKRLFAIEEAFVLAILPPTVRGIGQGGGFKMYVQDRSNLGFPALEGSVTELIAKANASGQVTRVFTSFNTRAPQVYLDIDRVKAQQLNVPVQNIFDALQTLLGTAYVNDFTALGRTFQVNAQADAQFRVKLSDVYQFKVRSTNGALVPLGTLITERNQTGPYTVERQNIYNAIALQGDAAPGVSTGQAIALMEKLAAETLPPGVQFEWVDLAYQEKLAGNTATLVFALAILFVFLFLAAQYESWALPLAIILITPLSLLAALLGVWAKGTDNNILTQIGFIVLIGLAAKNAILIVEFARQREDDGESIIQAAIDACKDRLRPIIMTSLAFSLGVVPLAFATGAASELRQAIGVAVLSGMVGVTILGLFLTPVFYVTIRTLVDRMRGGKTPKDGGDGHGETPAPGAPPAAHPA